MFKMSFQSKISKKNQTDVIVNFTVLQMKGLKKDRPVLNNCLKKKEMCFNDMCQSCLQEKEATHDLYHDL